MNGTCGAGFNGRINGGRLAHIPQYGAVADPKILKSGGGGGRQFISPRPRLSQMHTTIYMLFTRKKAAFEKKILVSRGGGRPHRPLESAIGTVYDMYIVVIAVGVGQAVRHNSAITTQRKLK